MFRPAKARFSGIPEDLRYLPPLSPFNPLVEILKSPAQLFAQSSSHTALASAHEADQDYGPRPRLSGCRSSLRAKRTNSSRFGRLLSKPFASIRFALRFGYLFSERFLR
jgi:hypothetical protein